MLFLIFLLLTIITALASFVFIFGLGWGLALLEFITGTASSGHPTIYVDLQNQFKKYKKIEYKLLGFVLLILACILFYITGWVLM